VKTQKQDSFISIGFGLDTMNPSNVVIQNSYFGGEEITNSRKKETSYEKLIKSRALNRSSKLKIYKSLIRPIVTYGCEAWTLTNRDEQYLRILCAEY